MRILTNERGVEDYTLACGTGSASVAVTLWLQGRLPGGKLTLTITGENGTVTGLTLEGPAEYLGTYSL